MPESFPIAPSYLRHRLAVLGGSLCLAAVFANSCGMFPESNPKPPIVDCSDPANSGITQPAGLPKVQAEQARRAATATSDHDNGVVHSELFGDMPLRGLRVQLSDTAIKKAVQSHPDSVQEVFYESYTKDTFRYDLMTMSPRGTTYEKNDTNNAVIRTKGGWSIAWKPEYRGLAVDTYQGGRNLSLAVSCQSYRIDQASKFGQTEHIAVQPTMEKPCSDPKVEIASYTTISDGQRNILCQSAAAVRPFDKMGVLKAIITKRPLFSEDDRDSGLYMSTTQTIALQEPLTEQTRPIHEWTHHLYQQAVNGNQQRELQDLAVAYDNMVTDKKHPEHSRAFAAVNEDAYLAKGIKNVGGQGHPYSNKNELLASATTVMRTWPERFIYTYGQASPADQQRIKQTVQAIHGLLAKMGGGDAAVTTLIPEIKDIQKRLALTQP